jgi:colicin import membrane protein
VATLTAERPPTGPADPSARAAPWLWSVALHVALVAAVAAGSWLHFEATPTPVHTVDAYVVHGTGGRAAPAAAAAEPSAPERHEPPAAEVTAPPPVPAAAARAEAVAEAQAVDKAKAEAQAKAEAHAQAEAQARAEAKAKAKAEADKAAAAREKEKEKEKEKAARAAEQKRAEAALAESLARDKAELAQRHAREADLARQIAGEEHGNALSAQQAGLLARYRAELAGRVQREWIRPPSAKVGLKCTVHVTQVPGGTVTSVKVGDCNADPAVRQSIESAVYKASPLPPPPDPSLFDRNLTLEFAPDA